MTRKSTIAKLLEQNEYRSLLKEHFEFGKPSQTFYSDWIYLMETFVNHGFPLFLGYLCGKKRCSFSAILPLIRLSRGGGKKGQEE